MTARTIVLNPVEPAFLSVRSALGVNLDLDITFLSQAKATVDPTPLYPQLALLPRSSRQVFAYDVGVTSKDAGTGNVQVPGTALIDPAGYSLELYQRRSAQAPGDPPVPVALLAKGVLRLEGSAYVSFGPLGMISTPVVTGPAGPVGPTGATGPQGSIGETGQRGSIWTTGVGDPTALTGVLPGDMYLDKFNGNVWRFDGVGWVLGTF